MRISTAQLAQLFTQTMQGAKDAGSLELKAGSIVRATLLEFLSDGEAMIQIGGSKLRAQLDANLQVGDRVNLLVTGQQQRGALELKVVSSTTGETASAQPDPAAVLKALRVPDSEAGRALVREFMARGVPLKADTLQAAAQALRQNAANGADKAAQSARIQTLGKMAELGIPINAGTFQAVHALATGPKLHELLTNIASVLAEALPESGESSQPTATAQATAASASPTSAANAEANGGQAAAGRANGAAPQPAGSVAGTGAPTAATSSVGQETEAAPVVQTASTAESQGQSSTRPAGTTAPTIAPEQPTQVQERTGAQAATTTPAGAQSASTDGAETQTAGTRFPENKISRPNTTEPARFSQAEGGKMAEVLSDSTRGQLATLSKVVRDLLDDSQPLTELGDKAQKLGLGLEERIGQAVRKLGSDAQPAQIRAALEAAVHHTMDGDATLKAALLQTQSSSAELSAAGLGGLTQDVSALLQQVTGQQVMQTAGTQRSDLLYQFAAVPVQVDGQDRTVELHVMARKGPGQKSLDAANCYVLFRLDMPRLGPLDVHLHIVDRVVGIRFQTEAQDEVGQLAGTEQATAAAAEALPPLELSGDDQRELRDRLQSVGFHLGVVKVEHKQETGPDERLPILPPILTQGALDLKI